MLRQEMGNCDHVFVKTERVASEKYPSVVRVFHCLKCGLTNEYAVKNIFNDLGEDMIEPYRRTFLKKFVISDKICSLGKARKLYQLIISSNPNISHEEMIEKFNELYKKKQKKLLL